MRYVDIILSLKINLEFYLCICHSKHITHKLFYMVFKFGGHDFLSKLFSSTAKLLLK